jgi:hypothetical protein
VVGGRGLLLGRRPESDIRPRPPLRRRG